MSEDIYKVVVVREETGRIVLKVPGIQGPPGEGIAGTTDDLPEGEANLYFTVARAQAANAAAIAGKADQSALESVEDAVETKASQTALDALAESTDEALAEKAALVHTHDASAIVSGVLDPARIPVLTGSRNRVISSGGIADLTLGQQNSITVNTYVFTQDGFMWVWTGSGSKTDEASYIKLADVTPEWSAVANKPSTFDTTSTLISDATAAGRAFLTALSVAAQKALLALGIGDVSGLQAALDAKVATADKASQVEAEAGTDNTKWVTPLRVAQAIASWWAGLTVSWSKMAATGQPVEIIVACSDETTNLTAGTAKVSFRMPFAMTVTSVRASVTVAQVSGSLLTVDINEGGGTILSTKLTIDNNERTSTTAATPPVISDASLADDADISIDLDQVGTAGARGLKVTFIGFKA